METFCLFYWETFWKLPPPKDQLKWNCWETFFQNWIICMLARWRTCLLLLVFNSWYLISMYIFKNFKSYSSIIQFSDTSFPQTNELFCQILFFSLILSLSRGLSGCSVSHALSYFSRNSSLLKLFSHEKLKWVEK